MDCPRCGAEMKPTHQPYEGWCEHCHLLWDGWTGKEIMAARSLTPYEQLLVENQRLKEALKPFADAWKSYENYDERLKAAYPELPRPTFWGFLDEYRKSGLVLLLPDNFRNAIAALSFSAINMTVETGNYQEKIALVQETLKPYAQVHDMRMKAQELGLINYTIPYPDGDVYEAIFSLLKVLE